MITTSKPATISMLNELIQLAADAIQLYGKAIARIDEATARADFESFMSDHGRHVAELTQVVFDLGGQAKVASREPTGAVLDVMTALRDASTTQAAIEAMRTTVGRTARTYERAAELRLPQAASRVVTRNLDDARRHLATIEHHLARAGGPTTQDLGYEGADIEITELDEAVLIELEEVSSEPA